MAHNARFKTKCAASYLGVSAVDKDKCTVPGITAIRASMVSKAEAPMLKFELIEGTGGKKKIADLTLANPGASTNKCVYWRVSIADGPCAGWYLDQNFNNVNGGDTHETRWTRDPRGSDI